MVLCKRLTNIQLEMVTVFDTKTKLTILGTITAWSLKDISEVVSILAGIGTICYIILNCVEKQIDIRAKKRQHQQQNQPPPPKKNRRPKNKGKMCLWGIVFTLAFSTLSVSCTGINVAKPQKGGSASVKLTRTAPTITITQPENSDSPSKATYERKILPVNETNFIVLSEKYTTELGQHQSDEARSGFAGVQKTAAVLKSQSPIMYAGIVLIVAAIAMSYFQAKFPLVFAPGLKIIALTFLTGLCLVILPAMTQDKTVLILAMLAGAGIITAYIFAKPLSSKTTTETTNNTPKEEQK